MQRLVQTSTYLACTAPAYAANNGYKKSAALTTVGAAVFIYLFFVGRWLIEQQRVDTLRRIRNLHDVFIDFGEFFVRCIIMIDGRTERIAELLQILVKLGNMRSELTDSHLNILGLFLDLQAA